MIPTQAPIIVFDDADLASAVNGVAFASFVASGQTCVSGTRILVQDGIYETFLEAFLAKVQSIRQRMGDRALIQQIHRNQDIEDTCLWQPSIQSRRWDQSFPFVTFVVLKK